MKYELLFIEEWVIIKFLKNTKNYFKNSKYIELLIALSLIKFCERQWNEKCWVGVEIKDKYQKELSANEPATHEQLDEIITKKVNENTPVDVAIAKMPKIKNATSKGVNFQIKRFGKNINKQDTQSLIRFLNEDCGKYGKSKTNLVVLIESPEKINLELLQKSIIIVNYPFEKIILVGFSENKYINYYGIWPESGWSRYNFNTFQFEF